MLIKFDVHKKLKDIYYRHGVVSQVAKLHEELDELSEVVDEMEGLYSQHYYKKEDRDRIRSHFIEEFADVMNVAIQIADCLFHVSNDEIVNAMLSKIDRQNLRDLENPPQTPRKIETRHFTSKHPKNSENWFDHELGDDE